VRSIRGGESFFEALVEESADGLLLVDDDRVIRWANAAAGTITGLAPADLLGRTTFDLQHPDDADLSRVHGEELAALPEGERPKAWHAIRRIRHADGSYHVYECTSVDLRRHPDVGLVLISMHDTAARHQAWETERRLRAMVENAQDAVLVYGRDLTVLYASPAVATVMDDLQGTLPEHLERFVVPEDLDDANTGYLEAMAAPGAQSERLLRLRRSDGAVNWVQVRATNLFEDPAVQGLVLNGRIVTQQIRLEQELRAAAARDPLTRLPNRSRIVEHLAEALATTEDPASVVVLFLDLDRFKVVNDSFGHATGDRVLVELGARLLAALGEDACVGRFGGDEYVVIAHVESAEGAVELADVLARAASEPFAVAGPDDEHAEVYLSASIGIALGTPGVDPATMLHHADAAMYRAKEQGRGGWELYDEGMRRAALARLTLEAELARALDDNGFELWYQPIIDVTTSRVDGFEALARWRHHERGLVPAAEFIAVAEETGGIHRLGTWALATACRQLRSWHGAGLDHLTLSVNLSPRQLTRDDLAADLGDLLADIDLDPASVCLEITETLLMEDLELAVKALSRLRDTGVHLALDDFGTGWSSLTYLRTVPVDTVKIDRSFIQGAGDSADDRAIVGAVVTMCRALGKAVVAEGVETESQFRALRDLGCTSAQGYLFARPLSASDVPAWLERYRTAGNRDPDRS